MFYTTLFLGAVLVFAVNQIRITNSLIKMEIRPVTEYDRRMNRK